MTQATLPPPALREIPLFAHFTNEECARVAEVAAIISRRPGEVIVQQGKQSQNLWIVLEGECEVVRIPEGTHDELVLATLPRYSNFGEMSFFHFAPHSASVRAKTAVKLLKLSRSDYDLLVQEECPAAYKLAYNTVESLAERVRRLNEWVTRLLSADARPSRNEEWAAFRSKLFQDWNL